MSRYYLNLHECGVISQDDEGRDLPNVGAALDAARKEARAIMAAEVMEGHLCLSCHIEVIDGETGGRVDLRFRDAITITGA